MAEALSSFGKFVEFGLCCIPVLEKKIERLL
jgi:hypothetical protein